MKLLRELIEKQRDLASRVILEDHFPDPLSTIAGVDVSFLDIKRAKTTALGAIVLFSYPELKVLDRVVVLEEISFPYVPGLLAFRELSVMKKAFIKLARKADIYLVDGQGIAHPRGLGIASHFGVELSVPTIGCAKNLLYGVFETPPKVELASSPLLDKLGREIGSVICPKEGGSQLIFVSPGHLVSVESATMIVKKLFRYSLPEPIRVTDILLREERRRMRGQATLL